MKTLDQLRPGQQGEIKRVQGCDGIACRLREMGFIPGETVRFLSAAPLGDPLNCIIHGCRIALRTSEAMRVSLVVPQPANSAAPASADGGAARSAAAPPVGVPVTLGAG